MNRRTPKSKSALMSHLDPFAIEASFLAESQVCRKTSREVEEMARVPIHGPRDRDESAAGGTVANRKGATVVGTLFPNSNWRPDRPIRSKMGVEETRSDFLLGHGGMTSVVNLGSKVRPTRRVGALMNASSG
jgi:hypothetical protein